MGDELDLIDWIRSRQHVGSGVLLAAGDDLAIMDYGHDEVVIGIDQVLEGVHFDLSVHSARQVGRKAMNRNLSDCAAMACLPHSAVVSIAIPRGMSIETVKEIYLGLEEAGNAMGCRIVGGDTGSWDQKLAISVAITGVSGGLKPVRRSGAKPGDAIYVTGPLGGSILGRHLTFVPRVNEARELASRHDLHAMIDLSDGISRDLAHLCRESGVGAVVEADLIPIHEDARKLGGDPLDHALHDGEDYELCFAAGDAVGNAVRIGTFTDDQQIWLNRRGRREPLRSAGFEHHF